MATAATAIIAKARRRILDHLMSENAVSAEQAVAYAPPSLVAERQLAKLKRAGVVQSTDSGRLWIDIPRYRRWAGNRRIRLGIGIVIAIATLASLA